MAKIRVFSRKFFFLWNYPNQIRVFSRIFLFLWNHTNPAEVSGGEDCYKGLFFVVGSFNSIDFFQGCFFITQSVYHKYVVAKSCGTIQKNIFLLVEYSKLWGIVTIYLIDVFLNHQYSNYWIRWSNLLFFTSWILFI